MFEREKEVLQSVYEKGSDKVTVLKNGVVIDGTGRAPVEDAFVVVKGNKIEQVGVGGIKLQDAETIDVDGKTIMPGMIELHGHMRWVRTGEVVDEGELALISAHALKQSLEKGITTVRSQGEYFGTAFAIKRAQARGLFVGSRIRVCGSLISTTGGHGNITADGPWECRKRVREAINAGADHIKIGTTHRPWRGLEEYTIEELNALVEETHRYKRKVACHAAMMPGMEQAIRAGVDTIEHGPSEFPFEIDDQTVRLMVESGVWWVPTLWCFMHEKTSEELAEIKKLWEFGPWDAELEEEWMMHDTRRYAPINFKKCRAGGVVKIATGTDTMGGNKFHSFGQAHEEAILFVKYGMSNMEAIKAATLNGAMAYGEDDKLGSIEPGKLADVIVVDGNPLKDITALRKVVLVMIDGNIFKNEL
jgi:imidazolonepropionase-like amidohydrolase